jgi:SAM-dependent methyltransferase
MCRACAATSFVATHDAPDTMYGTGESFPYGECETCGALTLLDAPDDFAPYYPPSYLSMTVDPGSLGAAPKAAITTISRSMLRGRGLAGSVGRVVPVRRVQTMVTILDSVARVPGPRARRVLDVGSGSGMVPLAVSLAGDVDVLGIDPFAAGDRQLGEHAELRAITLDDVTGRFDLVMLHHSLEHMLDPLDALRAVAAVLEPGGVLLVRVPTASSWAWREYRTDWIQLDPPRHVWIPSRPGMAALAGRAGLEIVATYDDSNEFQFWGSEQVRRGIVLTDPRSHYVDARASDFTARELRAYHRRSQDLNRALDGDQTVVYLRAVA